MRTFLALLPMAALLTACGSMQEMSQVRDDVYDIPDRSVVASVGSTAEGTAPQQQDDYYDPQQAKDYGQRNYYDMTYNDPYYYNYGRFGFGTGYSMGGPSFGMGMSYGSPSFGGYGGYGSYGSMGYGSGFYDPYYNNSWQSGYGAWGYNNGWNTWSPWNTGYGYGGYGTGYGYGWSPYQSPWGGCYGCYQPIGYEGSSVIIAHRPSMSGGGSAPGGGGTYVTPRSAFANPAGLMRPTTRSGSRPVFNDRDNTLRPSAPTQQPRIERTRPTRSWNTDTGSDRSRTFDRSPSPGGGAGNGGGSSPSYSPRPRR